MNPATIPKFDQFKAKYLHEQITRSDRWDVNYNWTLVYPAAGGTYPNLNVVLCFVGTQMWVLNPVMIEADEDILLNHFEKHSRQNAAKGDRTFVSFFDVEENPGILDRIVAFQID